MAEGNATLVLDYRKMCKKGTCECGGRLGYCLEGKRMSYLTQQCQNACTAWFPGDVTLAGACKSACQLDCGYDAACKPKSQADYLSRFTTDQQIISKYGYDFDPTTGTGSQILNNQKTEQLLSKIFNVAMVVAALVVVYMLLNKYLKPQQ